MRFSEEDGVAMIEKRGRELGAPLARGQWRGLVVPGRARRAVPAELRSCAERLGVSDWSTHQPNPMTRFRKFESWIKQARRAITHPGANTPGHAIDSLLWVFHDVMEQVVADPGRTAQLLDLARELRAERGKGQIVAERHLWEKLAFLTDLNARHLHPLAAEENGPESALASDEPDPAIPGDLQEKAREALQLLCAAAHEAFNYKCKGRDTWAGARRAACFSVWARAVGVVELPEVYGLAWTRVRQAEGLGTVEACAFLEEYFRHKVDEAPEAELERDLSKLAKRAKSHSTAVGALQVLVEGGVISELGALDRIYDWKIARHGG